MIRTLLIDDELNSCRVLLNLLEQYCPEIKCLGMTHSVKGGIELIEKTKPDLIFLDIAMPDGDGFKVLEEVKFKGFETIFVTAYEEFALKAFDFSAFHYLLKPVAPEELVRVIQQYQDQNYKGGTSKQLEILDASLNQKFNRIALPTMESIEFVKVDEVVRCEADGGYTIFYLLNGSKHVVSKSLGHYESLLSEALFYRIHHKHLVNLRHVKRYVRGSGGVVEMRDGKELDVSVRKKEGFLEMINRIAKM